ncbi:MAG: hypothetical protein JJU28_01970 [Cyclobacteriaceae bacterium]|nr:hypothetical protein [Cyclobacteriaceae bacterium]
MKHLLKFMMVGIVLTASLTGFARDGKYDVPQKVVKVIPAGESRYELIYFKEGPCQVKINIYNAEGKKIISEQLNKQRSFKRIYDFKELSFGQYQFELIDKDGVLSKTIFYSAPVFPSAEVFITKKDNEMLEVVVKGEKIEPVKVMIYDHSHKLIHEDYISRTKGFVKMYDLSRIAHSEQLIIEVVQANRIIKKTSI